MLLLLSSARAVRAMACADHLQSCFSKLIFCELIVFRYLNMDFSIFLTVNLSALSELSLSFMVKT